MEKLQRFTLSNGATLLCETVPLSEVIALGFWFLHGSRDEGRDERGFSHFLEHMIFKGTTRRTPADIACEIDRLGGTINAATEKEVTSLYASVPREDYSLVLDVMCDIAFGSTLPEEEIEKEKIVVQNEISSVEDSPEEKGYELFAERIWKGHPLAEKIAGSAESVTSITRAKLHQFYKKYFVPSNLVVTAAGNFDASALCKEIEERIDACAGERGRRIERPVRTPPLFVAGTNFSEDVFSQAQVYFATAFPAPAETKDYYVHLILSSAFGESMSSRLFQEIREKEGLCYSVYSSRAYYSDCALWLVYASTMPDLAEKLLRAMGRELERLKSRPLSRKEIDDARLQIKGSLILSKQDVEVRMKRLARQFIAMGEILSYEECYSIIDSITETDIEALTGEIFDKGGSNLFVYGCKGLKKLSKKKFEIGNKMQGNKRELTTDEHG